ncbi:MAG: hypothetical protein A3J46_01820 [Candidatus Yanofskybacteria bacterium RIFCSPHIGHO2_02_FULL_41_11]|uniref:Methyltransferase domain-containing protein n=1 Tax=Candidatus Yanofskybacteria bacterium RIFCSPHIGHO2_02_FULL_41_11 TaxID=1802675 RepID=A0A1F8F5P7_9BACT|nr:MAG: hypothetical protein A3J46_01820 [Candidatus Yanofskybacteria bacterium RIFCSPHIGHO2_02_FULL_41_11]
MLHPKFEEFLSDRALRINQARLEHLESLNLDLSEKKVLEVGAGIGLLSEFFEKRNCDILSTDSRQENITELKRGYPQRKVALLDLEKDLDPKMWGKFEVVFCYGTLYHLSVPEKAIRNLAKISSGIILVETIVEPQNKYSIGVVPEKDSVSQSSSRKGSRPTRLAVFKLLKKYFGFAYSTTTQPNHPDFITDWKLPPKQTFYRAVFIGSKKPLKASTLLAHLPQKQKTYVS